MYWAFGLLILCIELIFCSIAAPKKEDIVSKNKVSLVTVKLQVAKVS